jgi:hypothetical protein
MPEKLSFIESLTPAAPHGPVPGVFRIRPVLVDTSSLAPDVVWAAEHGRPSRFLASVEFGLLRPFAPHHVWAEVPRKLQDAEVLRGVDPQVAVAVWFNHYLPRLRIVDVSDRMGRQHRALVSRDPSDAPTAALIELIGPIVVLTGDRDLIDLDLAAADWIAAVAQGYTMTVIAQYGWGALFVGQLSGFTFLELAKRVARLARQPVGGFALACAGGLLVLTSPRWLPWVRPRLREAGNGLGEVLMDSILPMIAELADHYQRSEAAWEQRLRGRPGQALEQAAGGVLSTSALALSRTQIARHLLPDAPETERRRLVTRMGPVMDSTNAFVRVGERRWQLGRAGVDFGGVLDGRAVLDTSRPPLLPFELAAGSWGRQARRRHASP